MKFGTFVESAIMILLINGGYFWYLFDLNNYNDGSLLYGLSFMGGVITTLVMVAFGYLFEDN